MLHSKNYSMRPSKDSEQLDGDWEAPTKLKGVQEAVVHYAAILRQLWPMDDTPEVLWKVLIRADFGGNHESDANKAGLVTAFFNTVMIENAANAVKRLAPADYRRAREIWLTVLESHGVSGLPASSNPGQGQQKAGKKGGASGQKDNGSNRLVAKLGTSFVCHRFNETIGCPRFLMGLGCRGKNNQVFAHVCNYLKNDGKFCLDSHPKFQHK